MDLPVGSYQHAIDALFARTAGHIKPGLSRTQALLHEVGNPHQHVPSFHVAGTNGKGSVCATLDALLQYKGLRVGRYTSPHLIDFRERILINGAPISADDVLEFLACIEGPADRLGATFFEITTALAFWYLAKEQVDVAVIETGLGGTHDSTNVIDPLVATVTSIGLDHTEYLGPTLHSIAAEKAGIFKSGRPAVIGELDPELSQCLADRAAQQGASPIVVARETWRAEPPAIAQEHTTFSATTPEGKLSIVTPLCGGYQAQNTLTAIASLWAAGERYRLPLATLNTALAKVRLPGRFQRAGAWIFDVAHNPAGAHVLAENLIAISPPRPITAVVGVLGDKDWRGILEALAPAVASFIITQPISAPSTRAWNPSDAGAYAAQLGVQTAVEPDFSAAMRQAENRPGTKVVTGSFHTVGDAMQHLAIDPLIA